MFKFVLYILIGLQAINLNQCGTAPADPYTIQAYYYKENAYLIAGLPDHYKYILNKKKISEYNKLEWFSLGNPKLVPFGSGDTIIDQTQFFQFTNHGFNIQIDYLTQDQKNFLIESTKSNPFFQSYKISVKPEQIKRKIPKTFECNFNFFLSDYGLSFNGAVQNFNHFPLVVEFNEDHYDEQQIKELLENRALEIKCKAEIEDGIFSREWIFNTAESYYTLRKSVDRNVNRKLAELEIGFQEYQKLNQERKNISLEKTAKMKSVFNELKKLTNYESMIIGNGKLSKANGLIHYWPFSKDLNDAIGGKNILINYQPCFTEGRYNSDALIVSDLNIPPGIKFNLDFTISIWLRFDVHLFTYSSVLLNFDAYNQSITLGINNGFPTIQITIIKEKEIITSYKQFIFHKWNFLAVKLHYGDLEMYLNNEKVASIALKRIPVNMSSIQGVLAKNGQYLHLNVADLKIYNRSLRQHELADEFYL